MASYSVRIKTSASKELEKVEPPVMRRRIVVRIRALGNQPRPHGSEKLTGGEGRYRIRQGSFRIVYAIDDARKVVEIVKIGHRREIYR